MTRVGKLGIDEQSVLCAEPVRGTAQRVSRYIRSRIGCSLSFSLSLCV